MRSRGIVKWFDTKKGYGFIATIDHGDVFVHYSAIEGEGYRSLAESQEVEFDLIQTEQGRQAAHVVKVAERSPLVQAAFEISYLNTETGKIERHSLQVIKQFLENVLKNEPHPEPLPIKDKIDEIGNQPVFIKAETGVGKTVTVPVKVLLELSRNFRPAGRRHSPQLVVVEPRVPICINQAAYMNQLYREFVQQHCPGQEHGLHLFGCITQASGRENANAPIIFVSTGIFENMAENDQLISGVNRVIIDEAHITIAHNPGVEVALALLRQRGVPVDFMSATVDTSNIERDFPEVKIIEVKGRNYPLKFVNWGKKLEKALPEIVEKYLLNSGITDRPQGILVIVNSHLSEMSDTKKYARLINEKYNRPDIPAAQRVEALVLASPIVRDADSFRAYKNNLVEIEGRNGKYVIVATNVVDMGLTFDSLDYVVTMDCEYVNVLTDGSQTVELEEIAINTLFQRGGRAGRKRPGICFITNDFDSQLSRLSEEKLNNLHPTEIEYPLAKGNLQPLVFYSFKCGWSPGKIEEELARLRLPSKIEKHPQLFEKFMKERARMEELGLADGQHLTELGKKCLSYVGLQDLHFARLLAQAPPDLRLHVAVMCAAAEVSLEDLVQRQIGMKEEPDKGKRGHKDKQYLTHEVHIHQDDLGVAAEEVFEVLKREQTNVAAKLLDLGVSPLRAKEILQLVQDRFSLKHWSQFKGAREEEPEYIEELKRQGKKPESEVMREFLSLEKRVIPLSPSSDLISIHNILAYFYNKYYHKLTDEDLTELAREEIWREIQEEASALELNPHAIANALKWLTNFARRLKIPLPYHRIDEVAAPEIQEKASRLKLDFPGIVESLKSMAAFLKRANIEAPEKELAEEVEVRVPPRDELFTQCLQDRIETLALTESGSWELDYILAVQEILDELEEEEAFSYRAWIPRDIAARISDRLVQLNMSSIPEKVVAAYCQVIYPAFQEMGKRSEGYHQLLKLAQEERHFIPDMKPEQQRRFIDYLCGIGFHQRLHLKLNYYGNYVGEAIDEAGQAIPVELSLSSIQTSAPEIEVFAKLSPSKKLSRKTLVISSDERGKGRGEQVEEEYQKIFRASHTTLIREIFPSQEC